MSPFSLFSRDTGVLLAILSVLSLLGCKDHPRAPKNTAVQAWSVVATTPVIEHLVRRIAVNHPDIRIVQAFHTQGQCLHDHSVTTDEMRNLCSAAVIFANGDSFEPFLDKTLRQCPQIPVIRVGQGCGDLPAHEGGIDPHAWMGARGAQCLVANITNALATQDSIHSKLYQDNGALVSKQLATFWSSIKDKTKALQGVPVVSFHGSFQYLARELSMNMVASFGEEQEDASPSAQQIADLIQKIKAQQVKFLFLGENETPDLAGAVSRETGVRVMRLRNMMEDLDSNDTQAYEHVISADIQTILAP